MKEIPLTQGKVTLVDDVDYFLLSKYSWFAVKRLDSYYATRYSHELWEKEKRRGQVRMHADILGLHKGEEGDHIDGNTLNNQRFNLRQVTRSQNLINRRRARLIGTSSKYKGVYRNSMKQVWIAELKSRGVRRRSKSFKSETDAAKQYNEWAAEAYGEFARLNNIQG